MAEKLFAALMPMLLELPGLRRLHDIPDGRK
jgi:hypothetical protein